jgi:two-component system NtrC family sensor kinase
VIESIQQVLTLVDKQLRQNNVQVTTNFQPVPHVLAAPCQLNQIFLNLVLNAIEAAPDQGHLHLAIYPEQDYVVTTFINYGLTIVSEVLPHIFEPFFTTKPEGSGLGLWLCHTLVQQHQGALTVENLEDGKGVVSAVKLPLSRE